MTKIAAIRRNSDGQAAIDYALVAALMGLMALAGSLLLGNSVEELYARVGQESQSVLAVVHD